MAKHDHGPIRVLKGQHILLCVGLGPDFGSYIYVHILDLHVGLKFGPRIEGPHSAGGSMKDHIGTMVMFYIRSENWDIWLSFPTLSTIYTTVATNIFNFKFLLRNWCTIYFIKTDHWIINDHCVLK